MTIVAPDKARRPAATKARQRPTLGSIRLGLAPPTGEPAPSIDRPARLSGAARLGAALLLIIALLLQRTVLPLVPWGPADLVTVLVAVIACYAGPAAGCISGFGVGLGADVLSDHALGRLAGVLCLVGYLSGSIHPPGARRWWVVWLTVAGASVLTPLLFALTGAFAGDTRAAGSLLIIRCLAGLGYALVLAPVVYLLTRRLLSPRDRRRRGRSRRAHR